MSILSITTVHYSLVLNKNSHKKSQINWIKNDHPLVVEPKKKNELNKSFQLDEDIKRRLLCPNKSNQLSNVIWYPEMDTGTGYEPILLYSGWKLVDRQRWPANWTGDICMRKTGWAGYFTIIIGSCAIFYRPNKYQINNNEILNSLLHDDSAPSRSAAQLFPLTTDYWRLKINIWVICCFCFFLHLTTIAATAAVCYSQRLRTSMHGVIKEW